MNHKKLIAFTLIICILLCCFSSCSENSSENSFKKDFSLISPQENFTSINTYNCIGSDATASASFYVSTFKESYEKSEILAIIQITDRLGEKFSNEETGVGITYFSAKIIASYKGEKSVGDTIIVVYGGTSRVTFAGFPLFKCGSCLLVNLSEFNIKSAYNGYEYVYEITGGFGDLIEIANIENAYYAINRGWPGLLSDSGFENILSDERSKEILSKLEGEKNTRHYDVVELSELEIYINSLK